MELWTSLSQNSPCPHESFKSFFPRLKLDFSNVRGQKGKDFPQQPILVVTVQNCMGGIAEIKRDHFLTV